MLTSAAPRILVTVVPRHLAPAEGCFHGWPRPSAPLSRALQGEVPEMPTQKQYKHNLGTQRMRTFSLGVKIFNIFQIITNVSFPRSSLGGEEPSPHHPMQLGAAQSPTGKAPHGVGSSPTFPRASAHHPTKSSTCCPRRPSTKPTAVLQSQKTTIPP